jgi:hypothetical protein
MEEEKEKLYNKINPLINGVVGRLTIYYKDNGALGEAHKMSLEIANLLDEWINE